MEMARALLRGSFGNRPAAKTPAVEKDMAPKKPTKVRQRVCHQRSEINPVASSARVVVINPKENRDVAEYCLIISIVNTAPAI